jgi:hypothetical protein
MGLGLALFWMGCGGDPVLPKCAEGETACGQRCVRLDEDAEACGHCDTRCPEDEVCFASVCRADCPPGTERCDRTCRALETDPANCGSCGTACGVGEECARGACACPVGLARCGGACVDLETDAAHCGACDGVCAGSAACVGGACGCAGERRETVCEDGRDDDCDDLRDCADPDCADSVSACDGTCGAGVRRCAGGARGPCEEGGGGVEQCGNGIDDDCDGESLAAPDSLEPTDACDECYRMGDDPRFEIAATIDSVFDALDCYSFGASDDADYAERITVTLTGLAPDLDLDLHLYRGLAACEARTPAASSMAGPGEDESIDFVETLEEDETDEWYVRVVRVSGFSCDDAYDLVVEGLL